MTSLIDQHEDNSIFSEEQRDLRYHDSVEADEVDSLVRTVICVALLGVPDFVSFPTLDAGRKVVARTIESMGSEVELLLAAAADVEAVGASVVTVEGRFVEV